MQARTSGPGFAGSVSGWEGARGGGARGIFEGKPQGDGYQHFKRGFDQGGGGSAGPNRFAQVAIAALFPSGLLVYYLVHLDRAPVTGRVRMIDISQEREHALGLMTYNQLIKKYQVLPDDHPSSVLVARVGSRIAAASGVQLPWKFSVVQSPIVNAACMPGGKVVVFSGLLDLFRHDEAKVAVVLAHEIAHAVARHSAEQLAFAKLLTWAEIAISLVFDFRFITRTLVTLVGTLPYSRKLESEADFIGLELLARTCRYSPLAAVDAMDILLHSSGGTKQIEFLQTHPADDRRLLQLREWATQAETKRVDLCGHMASHAWPGSRNP